jgi:flagellin-specific chaperone FliS
MLEYCRSDLAHAFKNKRVNKEGHQLINMIFERISAYKKDADHVMEALKILDSGKYNEIISQKSELTKTRAHYKLV